MAPIGVARRSPRQGNPPMLRRPRRPREKRVVPLARATYSIAEFCDMTGLSRAAVLLSMDDGSLRNVKVGNRRLILARPANMRGAPTERETKA
jgi:hypothetical protein